LPHCLSNEAGRATFLLACVGTLLVEVAAASAAGYVANVGVVAADH